MHNLYLVAGRTASGKDYLVNTVAKKYGLRLLSSYTTRPMRVGETTEHVFITPDEVDLYRSDIVAYTKIGEYEYFSTKQQLLECDFYIIDPKGIEYLEDKIKNDDSLHDIQIHIIYIAADYVTRKHRALHNRKDKIDDFDARCRNEEDQFIDFECSQAWNLRITNTDNTRRAIEQLEQYIITNNKLEAI